MKRKTIQRGLAILLCMAMLLTIPAMAVFEDDEIPEVPAVSETDTVGELPEVPMEAPSDDDLLGKQAQPMASTVFSVTVPTTVAIHMDASGGITCGNITITNNSTDAVLIKDTQVSALNGWTLVDYATTTFTDANKGQHKIALQLSAVDGAISANGGSKTIGVYAKIPHQGGQITNASIAQVVFLLGWKDPPPADVDILHRFSFSIGASGYIRQGSSGIAPWSDDSTAVVSYLSHNDSIAIYKGTCSFSLPSNLYTTNTLDAHGIPAQLQDGIKEITVDGQPFRKTESGTWSSSGSLAGTYGSITMKVEVKVALDVATSVKDGDIVLPTPSPTPSATPTPTPT